MSQIDYIYNDPTTKDLIAPVTLKRKPTNMKFKINGYTGKQGQLFSKQHQAACCHYTMTNAINLFNSVVEKPVRKWAATNTLIVQPRAGVQLNAYYDRIALRFFYATDPVTKKEVFAINSTDVVAHELGHAILDAVRPDLFNLQSMEVWAFHEAFGDIHAIINAFQHDIVIDYVLKETDNDLSKSNVVTRLAEEMGAAIFHMTRGRMGHSVGFLRNAVNEFKYTTPEKLPRDGKDNQLTSECHSFSRVFTGAWYDILVAIYNQEVENMTPKEALVKARDVMTQYSFRSLRLAPATIRFYDAMAKAMLAIDKTNGYAYNKIMNQVFLKRRILRKAVKPMVALDWEVYKASVNGSEEVIEKKDAVAAVRSKKIECLPLPEYMVNVETPADSYYEFDKKGKCVDIITNSAEELIDHATFCVGYLKTHDMIRPDKQAPFEIDKDGNLVRSHFAACFNTNGTNPRQPEFNKFFKPENNSGCGCSGKPTNQCVTKPLGSNVVRATNIRPVRLTF